MKQTLIDTDILSLFLRGDVQVISRFEEYVREYGQINLSIITFYEIVSGLKHRDARKQLAMFLEFAAQNNVVPLTVSSVSASAEMYALTRAKGTPVDDIDLLIAGIAQANDWILVTHNRKHYEKIDGLEIEDWSE